MNAPLVSIIIPTYNRAHIIGETLESIISQTYNQWECIIVDDGSKDQTNLVVGEFIQRDTRFQFYDRPKGKPKGANACRNYGWGLAKGCYIKFFDSDDLMKPTFIQKQVDCLEANSSLDFCATFWEIWYRDGAIMKNKPYTDTDYKSNPVKSYLLESHIFPTPSPLWRKSYLDGAEKFNEELQRGQEADFHFNIMIKRPNYEFVEEFLFKVRVGHKSIKTDTSGFTANLSVLKYFINVSETIQNSSNTDRELLLQYSFFRMSVAFYNVIVKAPSVERESLFKTNFKILKKLAALPCILKSKNVFAGGLILRYFNKGYKYFYHPEYDHRLKINYV